MRPRFGGSVPAHTQHLRASLIGALTSLSMQAQKTTMKTVACALLLASAAALAPTPARTAVSKAAPKPALHYQVAAAATAFAPV